MNQWTPNAKLYDFGRPFPADKISALFDDDNLLVSRSNLRVLEPGCGTGRVLIPLARARSDWTFLGFDSSAEAVKVCRNKATDLALTNVEVAEGSLENFVSADQFDGIIHSSLLHAVATWRDALLILVKLLKPDGVVCLIGDYGDIYDEALGRQAAAGVDPNLARFWALYREIRSEVDAPNLEQSQVGCRWDLESTEIADWLLANDFQEISRSSVEWNQDFRVQDLVTIVEERCYSSMFTMDPRHYTSLLTQLKTRLPSLELSNTSVSRHQAVARFFTKS